MNTSNHISAHRMLLLYKQYINLYLKQTLIIFGATVVTITGFHTFMHLANLRNIDSMFRNDYHGSVFLFAFFGGCLIWCGQAFSAFRSKEKSMDYLMTPASSSEKYLFEFINRIIVFLIFFPILYWVLTNLVTGIFHYYIPEYRNYKFAYGDLIGTRWSARELTLIGGLALLMLTLPFTGATYFQKVPLLKTILIVALLVGTYVGMGVTVYRTSNTRIYACQ